MKSIIHNQNGYTVVELAFVVLFALFSLSAIAFVVAFIRFLWKAVS